MPFSGLDKLGSLEPYKPLVKNPHLSTIFANFAKRKLDIETWPIVETCLKTEPRVSVRMHSQRPVGPPRGEIVMVHGLEGSSDAGYMRSMSQLALEAGFAVHRTNMRSCGGTDELSHTMYHAGLTSDTLFLLRHLKQTATSPIYLVGYSLGGNVALKLAGELGAAGSELLGGVCGISTPIDLGACVKQMSRNENRIYEWRFLSRLKQRIRRRAQQVPDIFPLQDLDKITTVYEFDDKLTAQFFGFGSADNYYETQSSKNYLGAIEIPALVVQSEDDPLIPFEIFRHPNLTTNRHIELIAPKHGGHLGFIADRAPRFWVDRVILQWIKNQGRG